MLTFIVYECLNCHERVTTLGGGKPKKCKKCGGCSIYFKQVN